MNSLSPMRKEIAERIRGFATIKKYAAGEFILKEGQVCNKACLVVEGLTRSFYLNDGVDITSRLMDEGFVVTSWISYYRQEPSNEFIEAIEDTTLACVGHSDIEKLYIDFPEFNIIGRKLTEFAFFLAEQRTQLLRKHTAEEKYRSFLNNHPTLMQRVSLKHIATYLGMNEETLSRTRSKFHKNNS